MVIDSQAVQPYFVGMAKISLGAGIVDARGSVGGFTFSRNKGGAYARARVAPINVKSPAQTQVRANFSANAKAWGSVLGSTDRTDWTNFAAANPRVNILGASIILSGLAMYQSLSQVLLQIGGVVNNGPPPDLTVPTLAAAIGATPDGTANSFVINTDAQAVTADAKYYIFATKPLSPGKTPQTSDYRFIAALPAVALAVTVDIYAAYVAIFGNFTTGASIGVLVGTVNTLTGAVTPGVKFNTIAS